MTPEQANWNWIDRRVSELEHRVIKLETEKATLKKSAVEAHIGKVYAERSAEIIEEALEARIKDLETALAFYKKNWKDAEQTGGPCIPMCPPSVCDCMGKQK